jgi:hypothetical protein
VSSESGIAKTFLLRGDEFRVRSRRARDEHALAGVGAPSRGVVAENRRERVRAARASAQVDVVDPGGLDLDEHLAFTGLRLGDLLDL